MTLPSQFPCATPPPSPFFPGPTHMHNRTPLHACPRPDSLDFYDSTAANPLLRPVLNITYSLDAAVVGAEAEELEVEAEGLAEYYTDDNAGEYAHFVVKSAGAVGSSSGSTHASNTDLTNAGDNAGAGTSTTGGSDDGGALRAVFVTAPLHSLSICLSVCLSVKNLSLHLSFSHTHTMHSPTESRTLSLFIVL
jgi:hypothetical protein